MTTTIRTTPDLLRGDGTTAAIVTGPDGTTLDVVSLPADSDRARWDATADQALADAGWARAGAWAYVENTGELAAPVVRLRTVRFVDRDGQVGPLLTVRDVDGAVRDEYGPDAQLVGGQQHGRFNVYDVATPSDEPSTWQRLGGAILDD